LSYIKASFEQLIVQRF